MEQLDQSRLEQPRRGDVSEPRRPTNFESGSTFGEYTIVRRIGRGGQGSVFEVRDGLGLSWALKVSEEMVLQDANAEMRFAREARCVAESLSQLPRHSGVFVGEHYGVWDRRFYVKMKLLRGESLAQRLRRVGQLSIYEAVRIAERIAFAIGQAHEMGVLHRDLKPENVFLTEAGDVVVLDWGCLQLIEAGQQKTTLRGVVCTPGYAPIEQYLATTALNLTPAVDLYALGVMLYEALAGYHPFLNWSRAALPPPAAPRAHEVSPNAELVPAKGPMAGKHAAASESPLGERGAIQQDADRRSVITVRVAEDVFGAQTERHVVPEEVLSHLRGIVTGGVTWRSARSARAVKRTAGPFGTANTQPVSARPSEHQHNDWTLSPSQLQPLPQPAAVGSTRTMPRLAAVDATAQGGAAVHVSAAAGTVAGNAHPERRPTKGDPPRRFSLIEVLTFQERVKPHPIEGVPAELDALLSKLLAKRPDERPQDALDVAQRLRALLPLLLESPLEFAASTPEQNSRYLTRALLWIRLRQNGQRWTWAAAGVAMAALTGAASYYGMNASRAANAPVTVENALLANTAPVMAASAALVATATTTPAPERAAVRFDTAVRVDLAQAEAALTAPGVEDSRPAATVAPVLDVAAQRLDKKKRRRAQDVPIASAAAEQDAPVTAPARPAASVASAPCDKPCDSAPGETEPGQTRRLQAKPNAVLHRSSNKLWLE